MKKYPDWEYDECRQVGKDYGMREEVEVYDSSHADFRDVASEHESLLRQLGLDAQSRIADIGCGTGAFAIAAARVCKQVIAVDVSDAMLRFASDKAVASGNRNVEFKHNGFLDVEFEPNSLDTVISSFSLHHLPDYWKGRALRRIWRALKPHGWFFLRDVVYPDDGEIEVVNEFIAEQEKIGGDFLREDAVGHFKEEFSTYSWIMEGLIERSDFEIENLERESPIVSTYLCRKVLLPR